MSALTDLQTAVGGLSASVDAAVTAMRSHADDSAALVAVTAQINDARSRLDQAVSAASPTPPAQQ